MKKSLLLLVAGAITMSAGAQQAKSPSLLLNPSAYVSKKVGPQTNVTDARHSGGRTTSIVSCAYTETFPSTVFTTGGSGGATDVWTAGTNGTVFGVTASPNPGTWKWANSASGSPYSVGPLASATAANGWMIFDADSLTSITGNSSDLPGGWLQSPAINCMALTTVGLSFQELFDKGVEDTCLVEVSTSSTFATGVTYYPVYRNNNLFPQSTTPNPDTILLDITSAAAGQPAVYIRFVYQNIMDFDFSWLIDDVCVGALSAHDVGLYYSYIDQPFGGATTGAFSSSMFSETPLKFVDPTDSIYPVSTITNYAHATEATIPVTATLSGTGSPAYSQTYTYNSLPVGAIDSGFVFPGYIPATMGTYTFTFDAALGTDTDPGNNIQTASFGIDDTIWNVNSGTVDLGTAYYLYGSTASTGLATPLENCSGARFDLGNVAVGDTVSGFGVGFAYFSDATGTGKVCVQLYSNTQGSPAWTYVGESYSQSLTTAEYSTSSGVKWTDFRTCNGYTPYGGTYLVLQPNTTYAAIVQMSGVTSDLLIYSTDVPNATYFDGGYFGQSGTSTDGDGQDFGANDQTGTTYVPLVQMYLGNIPKQNLAVENIATDNFIGQPFPNPSNFSFTIPFTMAQDSKVTVTLTDIMGQVINAQTVNAIGGHTATTVFNTSSLASGMYIYTVQGNGVNTTGRVVVSH